MKRVMWAAAVVTALLAMTAAARADNYKNFRVAVYFVNAAQQYNEQQLQQQYDRITSQVKIDKVYIEVYRSRRFADENAIEPVKKFFTDRGIQVAGGVTLTWNDSGQFETFSFANPEHRAECQKAVEMAARHFDEVILDDFFFYATKTDADIAAKGNRSWTQYRLEAMRDAAENLVLKPARAINPKIKMVIKYPNWYEHFQASGYDLDQEAKAFDGIYTGTETRDPLVTDQLLQQYESYEIFRYFNNIKPNGGDHGGWVDTFNVTYVDRYAEQLWDTAFAKAPEITLFNWTTLAGGGRGNQPVPPGARQQWANQKTSFDYDAMVKGFQGPGAPGYARVAGYSLEQVDAFLGKLGKPIGIAAYKPYQSSGDDFLHNYLGMIGIPIEMQPTFPEDAKMVLLTESAKADPDIVAKIKKQLTQGGNVMITSGLWRALQGRGIEDICELEYTDHRVAISDFLNAYGAGNGQRLNAEGENTPPQPAILFPEMRFYTNDSWVLVRGVASGKGFPILLMNKYSKGIFYVLVTPDNMGDLYNLPAGVTRVIRSYLMQDFPVRVDGPARVSEFAYDNDTFIVESFLPTETKVTVNAKSGVGHLRNLVDDSVIEAQPAAGTRGRFGRGGGGGGAQESRFEVTVMPHSYVPLRMEK
ncbi:MAG TPA: hypothetical protein VHQ47_15685 [Phycisphaerae bacterium]|nr:hypothetical protein [Phycisphaerae bacterium]